MPRRLTVLAIVSLLASLPAFGQTTDTAPRKIANGATLPAACTFADVFVLSGVSAGNNWYICTAANTWTLQNNSTGIPGLIATPAIVGNGTTNDSAALSTYLGVPGGTVIINKGLNLSIDHVTVTANNVTLDLSGSTMTVRAATTGIVFNGNGISTFRIMNGTIDGASIVGLTALMEFDNSANIQLGPGLTIMNAGTPAVGNFEGGITMYATTGTIAGVTVKNVAGYCMKIDGNSDVIVDGNDIGPCYKDGVVSLGGSKALISNNKIHDIYDTGASSNGAAGNAIYFTNVNGGVASANKIRKTEYSGIRVAGQNLFQPTGNVAITGNTMELTGDWAIYAMDFYSNSVTVTGNNMFNSAGGGVDCGNGGDNMAYGCQVTGNSATNMMGGSTNGNSLTPVFAQCYHVDAFANVGNNVCDGSYYGAVVDNGENAPYIDIGSSIHDNLIYDDRIWTLALSGTSGNISGAQNGVANDKIYKTSGGSLAAASVKAFVASCIPVASGVNCTSPTSINVKMIQGKFVATDTLTDAGFTGNLTATIDGAVGPANYDTTISSTTNFNIYDSVHVGAGATRADGLIICAPNRVGCPTGHIMISSTLNPSNLRVVWPGAGTIVDDTSAATATITAVTAHAEGLQVGVMAAKFDTATRCSIKIANNDIYSYAVQPIGGIQDSAGVPDNTVVALGASSCVTRSPLMGNGPAITSGFGTSPVFVGTPTDMSFSLNVGTGGAATGGVITWGTAYTLSAPNCNVSNTISNINLRGVATLTTYTITSASAWTASDILNVNCAGGQ